MNPEYSVGAKFPDFELTDFRKRRVRIADYTKPSPMDDRLGFDEGYPLIVVFYRGFYCPRDGQQMRLLVQFQDELAVNYCRLVAISTDAPLVAAAYRYGLGASWAFLSDEKHELIDTLGILDETEGEWGYCAQPFTFVLNGDLTIHKIYNGWFFVGRPTLEELRQDLRTLMQQRKNYTYEAYNTPDVKAIRIPAQEWVNGAPELGANGLPVQQGTVKWFRYDDGYGMITDEDGKEYFFHFTAIPGEGYRTAAPGTNVRFEVVEGAHGLSARNVQAVRNPDKEAGPGSLQSKLYSGTNRG
jgi:cold shock CspA family protein/peroxiredoxin